MTRKHVLNSKVMIDVDKFREEYLEGMRLKLEKNYKYIHSGEALDSHVKAFKELEASFLRVKQFFVDSVENVSIHVSLVAVLLNIDEKIGAFFPGRKARSRNLDKQVDELDLIFKSIHDIVGMYKEMGLIKNDSEDEKKSKVPGGK